MFIVAAENAGHCPRSLHNPFWVKMSEVTSNGSKKRKKPDAKPQSQINKCLNEKRRRTQENLYIDELAELISVTDMSSGKTDKCQILQRTVEQIRHINRRTGSICQDVQQGEVSSTNPNVLSNDQIGLMLLEALDGFLFVVNTEGRVEYVTDNIAEYINYSKDDVLGKDVFNIIHHGDHHNFMGSFAPSTVASWSNEPQTRSRTFDCRFLVKPPDEKEETMEQKQQRISKYETMQICAALLPSNGIHGSSSCERLDGGNSSKNNVEDDESPDIGPCVMCVARRIPLDEKRIGQFTLKMDKIGKIIAVDTSWLSSSYAEYLNTTELINTKIQDLCHPSDLNKLTTHLNDALQTGESVSPIYRMHISANKFLNVQTKSKLFKAASGENGLEADFIMATNSIFRDNDLSAFESSQLPTEKQTSIKFNSRISTRQNTSNNTSVSSLSNTVNSTPIISNNRNNSTNINSGNNIHIARPIEGVSGQKSSRSVPNNSTVSTNLNRGSDHRSVTIDLPAVGTDDPSVTFNNFTPETPIDLEFELFPSTSLELENSTTFWPVENMESDSLQSKSEVHAQVRSQQVTSGHHQQSIARSATQSNVTSLNSPAISSRSCSPLKTFSPNNSNTFNTFSFSPLQGKQSSNFGQPSPIEQQQHQKQTRAKNTNDKQIEQQPPEKQVESVRLRNLLTKGTSVASEESENITDDKLTPSNQPNRILKILLNQQDEEDYQQHIERQEPNQIRMSIHDQPKPSLGSTNNMLLQLLNDKNDNEDDENITVNKNRNELLTQLLKEPEDEKKLPDQKSREDDPLLRSLGFRSSSPSSMQEDNNVNNISLNSGQKRPVEDAELNVATKRAVDCSLVTSSAICNTTNSVSNPSKLWEKNRMLASLLAKQPTQPTTIPPIPASVISATPQDKLPRVLDRKQILQQHQNWVNNHTNSNHIPTSTATINRMPIQNQTKILPRPLASTYLSHLQTSQVDQMDPNFVIENREFRQPTSDSSAWEQPTLDPDLSDILDQVIDIAPESIADNTTIANLLDVVESQRNEKLAINAIQESLMQIETTVNPSTSNISLSGSSAVHSTTIANNSTFTSRNYQSLQLYQQQSQHQTRTRLHLPQSVRQVSQFSPQQQQVQIQRKMMQQQQQLKQRLLQQQQQQQLLIPSNATATDPIASGIHNIDSLLNNTVAPNVTLQRSSISEQQVSPNYGGSIHVSQGQQHRLPHAYSHSSAISQLSVSSSFNSTQTVSATARLSPQSPVSGVSFSHHQPLSPRVIQQGTYANHPRMLSMNPIHQQSQSSQQTRVQQQRLMSSSSVTTSARQSPFPAETFPPSNSPTTSQFTSSITPVSNPPSYRLQRPSSVGSTGTQTSGNTTSSGNINSEYVRKELRTVVDARMQQHQRLPSNSQNNLTTSVSQEELENLGLAYEMTSGDYYGRITPR